MKIAIIEDDKITRLELSKLLNSHGYETVLLTDFENLSEESKKYSFDLILLDINLPVSYTHLTLPTNREV